jgi:hypothetical protein
MEWAVEYTDEFGDWWDTLTEAEQIRIDAHVRKLEQRGPNLPYSSGIHGSRHAHMRASPCGYSMPSIRAAWLSC